jgi:hypothetical protein
MEWIASSPGVRVLVGANSRRSSSEKVTRWLNKLGSPPYAIFQRTQLRFTVPAELVPETGQVAKRETRP